MSARICMYARMHLPTLGYTRVQMRTLKQVLGLGCADASTQEGGASHDGFGVLVSTTFPLLQNHKFAHDLLHRSWVHVKVHLMDAAGLSGACISLTTASRTASSPCETVAGQSSELQLVADKWGQH